MNSLIARSARVLSWLLGAVASGVAWFAISVYGLGLYDEAYGRRAIFQIGAVLAIVLAALGLIGYAGAVAVSGSRQTTRLAAVAGAAFTLAMQCMAIALGHAMPAGVPAVLLAFMALSFGAATSAIHPHNEV